MRKVSSKQISKLKFKTKGGHNVKLTPFIKKLLTLKINEAILIKKEEWTLKKSPVSMVSTYTNKKTRSFLSKTGLKFSGRTLKDDSGWVITRIDKKKKFIIEKVKFYEPLKRKTLKDLKKELAELARLDKAIEKTYSKHYTKSIKIK